MIKKDYKKVHLYILGNSRKIAIFFGFTHRVYISLHSIVNPFNQSGCEIRQTHR